MEYKFKNFHKRFKHLETQESIEFYSIFDGYPLLSTLKLEENLALSIQYNILDKVDELKDYFIYDTNASFQKDLESILTRLAIGDRKNYTVYKKENISQLRGRVLYKALFEKGIIKKEKSREKPKREFKGQLIKKSLRRYEVQDKIHFTCNFTRFWFTYIAPFEKNPLQVDEIMKSIESHISLTFEELSNELIIYRYKKGDVVSQGSYWDKNIEIDMLIKMKNGTIIAGESKWKSRQVCKNILKKLERKCERAELGASKFAIFSKSGFSKELKSKKSDDMMLFELKDFEVLHDR